MTGTLSAESLARLRDEAEEHVRLGGFANSQTWIQECPPSVVLAMLDRIDGLEQAATKASAELRHTFGHTTLGQAINPDLVARAIHLLEEATTPKVNRGGI